MNTPHWKFYEMTNDRIWATGRQITRADKRIDPDSLSKGKNFVGRAITKVKNGYILEEVCTGRREPDQINLSLSVHNSTESESEQESCH